MGILNKKQRIVDTVITPLGRKNLSRGNLGIKFIAFTDKGSMYLTGSNSIRESEFKEIELESNIDINDNIFFSTEGIGKNQKYKGLNYEVDLDGSVSESTLSYSSTSQALVANQVQGSNILNGFGEQVDSAFLSIAGIISDDILEKIKNKRFVMHKQDEDFQSFQINKSQINFSVSDNIPIKNTELKEINVNAAEPLFFDQYVSNTDVYSFLPPVFPKEYGENKTVGKYTDLNQKNIETFNDIVEILEQKPVRSIEFEKNSFSGNIVMQIFETTSHEGKMIKMDTIDFGEFVDEEKFKKVIFAGKTFIDEFNYPTYINLFTIILEE